MMSQLKFLAIGLILVAALPLVSQGSNNASGATGGAEANKRTRTNETHQTDGERKFAQNCGRCHNPPEGFSPHISGTILQHMRVRASLSKKDEEDILRFLNP